jgi:hypothetical protein
MSTLDEPQVPVLQDRAHSVVDVAEDLPEKGAVPQLGSLAER